MLPGRSHSMPRSCKLAVVALLCLIIACNPGAVIGFDSFEHRDLSNTALGICLELLGSSTYVFAADVDTGRKKEVRELLATLLPGPDTHLSYGDLVASVDHYRDPELFKSRKMQALRSHAGKSNWWEVGIRHLRAVHGNQSHFQGDAIDAIKNFHSEAIAQAASTTSIDGLRDALVINALADHFIEDFLASGHAAAPRSQMHDVPSASLHDTYNKLGIPFIVRTDGRAWKNLVEISEGMMQTSAAIVSSGEKPRLDISRSELGEFVKRIGGSGAERKIIFFGDDELRYNSDQKNLVALLIARSDLDVVESYLRRKPIDALQMDGWRWQFATVKPIENAKWYQERYDRYHINAPLGDIVLGSYDLGTIYSPKSPGADPGIFKVKGLMLSGTGARNNASSWNSTEFAISKIMNVTAPVGAIKFERDGKPTNENATDVGSTMVAVGVSYLRQSPLAAFGLKMDSISPLGTNSQIRFRVGYGDYRYLGRNTGKLDAGLFYERGFGLLFADIGIERNYHLNEQHSLKSRWLPAIGLNLMLPLTWVDHIRPKRD